jgi:hypothetical protein
MERRKKKKERDTQAHTDKRADRNKDRPTERSRVREIHTVKYIDRYGGRDGQIETETERQ